MPTVSKPRLGVEAGRKRRLSTISSINDAGSEDERAAVSVPVDEGEPPVTRASSRLRNTKKGAVNTVAKSKPKRVLRDKNDTDLEPVYETAAFEMGGTATTRRKRQRIADKAEAATSLVTSKKKHESQTTGSDEGEVVQKPVRKRAARRGAERISYGILGRTRSSPSKTQAARAEIENQELTQDGDNMENRGKLATEEIAPSDGQEASKRNVPKKTAKQRREEQAARRKEIQFYRQQINKIKSRPISTYIRDVREQSLRALCFRKQERIRAVVKAQLSREQRYQEAIGEKIESAIEAFTEAKEWLTCALKTRIADVIGYGTSTSQLREHLVKGISTVLELDSCLEYLKGKQAIATEFLISTYETYQRHLEEEVAKLDSNKNDKPTKSKLLEPNAPGDAPEEIILDDSEPKTNDSLGDEALLGAVKTEVLPAAMENFRNVPADLRDNFAKYIQNFFSLKYNQHMIRSPSDFAAAFLAEYAQIVRLMNDPDEFDKQFSRATNENKCLASLMLQSDTISASHDSDKQLRGIYDLQLHSLPMDDPQESGRMPIIKDEPMSPCDDDVEQGSPVSSMFNIAAICQDEPYGSICKEPVPSMEDTGTQKVAAEILTDGHPLPIAQPTTADKCVDAELGGLNNFSSKTQAAVQTSPHESDNNELLNPCTRLSSEAAISLRPRNKRCSSVRSFESMRRSLRSRSTDAIKCGRRYQRLYLSAPISKIRRSVSDILSSAGLSRSPRRRSTLRKLEGSTLSDSDVDFRWGRRRRRTSSDQARDKTSLFEDGDMTMKVLTEKIKKYLGVLPEAATALSILAAGDEKDAK